MLSMATEDNIPDDGKKLAMETETAIKSGKIHPFQGPIKDQDGKVRAKAGEVLDDGTLLGMNWYVEGVEGKLPQ